jgi:glycyl-tRNA synthetase beta chain
VAALVQGVDLPKLLRAVTLSKADLATGMVGEFPELQGYVGSFYAETQEEDLDIVKAIATQYQLGKALDAGFFRDNPMAAALALVDHLDSLLSFFAAGEKTTGSKDPYGLRRLAYGIIDLILNNPHVKTFNVSLLRDAMIQYHYPETEKPFADKVFQEAQAFLLDKAITTLTDDHDIPLDIVRDVLPPEGAPVDLVALSVKAKALADFSDRETLQATMIRLKGLWGGETALLDEGLLHDPLEKAVYEGLSRLPAPEFPVTWEKETIRLQALIMFSGSIHAMLDALRINDPVYGTNRRALVRNVLARYVCW